MNDPVLVTGAGGMLGTEFSDQLEASGARLIRGRRPDIDLDFPQRTADFLRTNPCRVVIHCAAETNVDLCESDPVMAMRRNSESTMALATASQEVGAKFVFISSSGVFDGKKSTPYTEFDGPAPCTVYAESKVAAEEALIREFPSALIVRAGWLFGGATTQKKNFVAARWREAQGKPEIVSASDKTGSPTWVRDLVGAVGRLVEVDASGVVHAVNSGSATREEYVSEILRLCHLPTRVRGVSSSEFPRTAPVPDNEALVSERLESFGLPGPRPWQEALQEYLESLGMAETTPG